MKKFREISGTKVEVESECCQKVQCKKLPFRHLKSVAKIGIKFKMFQINKVQLVFLVLVLFYDEFKILKSLTPSRL